MGDERGSGLRAEGGARSGHGDRCLVLSRQRTVAARFSHALHQDPALGAAAQGAVGGAACDSPVQTLTHHAGAPTPALPDTVHEAPLLTALTRLRLAPAGFAVDTTALATVAREAWVVGAPEGPLEALAAAGAQALCPGGPGRPATIHSTFWIGPAATWSAILAEAELAAHLDALPRPVTDTIHQAGALTGPHTQPLSAQHLPFWAPATWAAAGPVRWAHSLTRNVITSQRAGSTGPEYQLPEASGIGAAFLGTGIGLVGATRALRQ